MIEIKFEAKGENLNELIQHMDMALDLIQLNQNDEKIEDCINKGNTQTSSYEYSIQNVKEEDNLIIGVAIKHKGGVHHLKQGSHSRLAKELLKEGHSIQSSEITEGFILADGTFLNRIEAAKHAIKIRQVKEDETLQLSSKLYSQDLW